MSNKIQNILVPIDFTEYSYRALKASVDIAEVNNAVLVLLHVIDLDSPLAVVNDTMNLENLSFESIQKMYLDSLIKLKDEILVTNNVKIEILIDKGNVVDSILDRAKKFKSDLIIIGTHGAKEKIFFLGINAYQIIKKSECAVMTIPRMNDDVAITKLIFPSNNVITTIDYFKKLVQNEDLAIEIVGLNSPNNRFNISILNETINYLENNLSKAVVKSSDSIQVVISKISDTLFDLDIKLMIIDDLLNKNGANDFNVQNSTVNSACILRITENVK